MYDIRYSDISMVIIKLLKIKKYYNYYMEIFKENIHDILYNW